MNDDNLNLSDPKVYLHEIVAPMCARLAHQPNSIELAVASCILIYHFYDIAVKFCSANGGKMPYASIVEIVPEFDVIQAIANGAKHGIYNNNQKNEHKGFRIDNIILENISIWDDSKLWDDKCVWVDELFAVHARMPNNSSYQISVLCEDALRLLENNLEKILSMKQGG